MESEPELQTWTFDVGVTTHDLLKAHVVVAHWRRVVVCVEPNEGYLEASLLAYALASVDDVLVTTLWYVE